MYEVALEVEGVVGGVVGGAEVEVVGGGVEWVVDAADRLSELFEALHLYIYLSF
jgi:hypothetical protein